MPYSRQRYQFAHRAKVTDIKAAELIDLTAVSQIWKLPFRDVTEGCTPTAGCWLHPFVSVLVFLSPMKQEAVSKGLTTVLPGFLESDRPTD